MEECLPIVFNLDEYIVNFQDVPEFGTQNLRTTKEGTSK
jgi:hypothetical protein